MTSGRADAEGCDERGAARLGRQRRQHVLHHRHRGRPASLSRAGARLPVDDRQRSARADAWSRRPPARHCWSLAVGGGSNAIGLFHPFLDDADGEDASASRRPATASRPTKHAASLAGGAPVSSTATAPILLQDEDGQITEAHSISAGLDYPGIGPEHRWLHESGRVTYVPLHRCRGARFLPDAVPSSKASSPRSKAAHALAVAERTAPTMGKDQTHRSSMSAAGETRTSSPSPRHWG